MGEHKPDEPIDLTLLPCRTCGAAAVLYKLQGTLGPLYYVRCAADLHSDLYKSNIEQAVLDWNAWARGEVFGD